MDDFVNSSGHLEVKSGHQLYWEDWGNPEGRSIMSLHGGPGSGFSNKHKLLFDPEQHHVVFHDQRGAGKSTPFASVTHNTTQDLVSDVEQIRTEAGLEEVILVGGSWGSTLALCYAIEFPQNVSGMVLWGIYLGSQFENDWVNEGYPRYNFPVEWERFIGQVPEEFRSSGESVMRYYADKIHGTDEEVARYYAIEWTLWESSLTSIEYDPKELYDEVSVDPKTLAIARIETHYFKNKCFLAENHILENLDSIKHIPANVVQGRFDFCTPPVTAYNLANLYGENMSLEWVNSGHLRTDQYMISALRRVIARQSHAP